MLDHQKSQALEFDPVLYKWICECVNRSIVCYITTMLRHVCLLSVAVSVARVFAADFQPYGSDGATFEDGTAEVSETTTVYDLRANYLRETGGDINALTNNKDLENKLPEAWAVTGDGEVRGIRISNCTLCTNCIASFFGVVN